MRFLRNFLEDKRVRELDVDGADRMSVHRAILSEKPIIRDVFVEFHHLFKELELGYFSGKGILVEIGAGVAPVRDSYRDVIATDIVKSEHLDCVLDAGAMNLESGSVRAFFGQNCFHHFPHPDQFFREAIRTLAPGGGIILIEPYHGPLARLLFPRLFSSEGYDKNFPAWDTPASGPMNGANQALSYIVFKRDRERFEATYPALEIVMQRPLNSYMRYLLSGGLNFRQLIPEIAVPLVRAIERLLSPFDKWLALHHVIVLRKIH